MSETTGGRKEGRLKPHSYSCRCSRCRNMAAAIGAQNADGSYAFTEPELEQLSMTGEDPPDAEFLEEQSCG
ncbi:MAG: hypothetical protein NVS1B6_00180 [Steroidobacteraceae bacterium]